MAAAKDRQPVIRLRRMCPGPGQDGGGLSSLRVGAIIETEDHAAYRSSCAQDRNCRVRRDFRCGLTWLEN